MPHLAYHNQPGESWLFRGQGQDYPLIPSAFRKDDRLASLLHRRIEDYSQRRRAERDALTQFFNIADKRGLILPDDSQELRSRLETLSSPRGELFIGSLADEDWQPDKTALSLTALAQHYGVPTRLLDSTRRPLIAAFFAAEDAIRHFDQIEPTSLLIVWAFFYPALGRHDVMDKMNDPVQIVTAPSATNPNLKAQQGVFTLLNRHYTHEDEGSYLPMEQVLEELADRPESRSLLNDCWL